MSQRELIFIHEEMLIPHFQSADLFSLFGKRFCVRLDLCKPWIICCYQKHCKKSNISEIPDLLTWNVRDMAIYTSLTDIKYEYRFVFSDYIFCLLISSKISYIFSFILTVFRINLFRANFKTFLYIFEVDFVDNLLVPNVVFFQIANFP